MKTYNDIKIKINIIYEIISNMESINEYKIQNIMDNQFKVHNKQNVNSIHQMIFLFCNYHKIKCFGYDWKMQQFITNKNERTTFNTHSFSTEMHKVEDKNRGLCTVDGSFHPRKDLQLVKEMLFNHLPRLKHNKAT